MIARRPNATIALAPKSLAAAGAKSD